MEEREERVELGGRGGAGPWDRPEASLPLIFRVSHFSSYSLSLYSVVSSFFRLWRPHSPPPGQLNTETYLLHPKFPTAVA